MLSVISRKWHACVFIFYIFHFDSAGGAVLLVGGLYAVLWGKHVEGKSELKSESEDTEDESKSKEETA